MTPRDLVMAQIDHQETKPVPYSLGFEGDVPEQLDRHYGSDAWRQKLVSYFAAVGGQDTWLRRPKDDSWDIDAYGSLWRTDRRPFHLEKPGMPEPSFDGYDFPSVDLFLEAAQDSKAEAKKMLAEEPDRYRFIGMGWGLFESSWGIRGFENALMDVAAHEDFYIELLDRITDHFLAFVDFWKDVPADAIMFGDDWGDQRGVIVGPDRWRKLFKPRYAKIYEATHAQGKKCISHCCGSVADIMDDIVEIGLDVLESVQPEAQGMNPYELKRRWGDKIAFWGCLGSQSTLQFGTPDEIRAEVRKLRHEMGRGGGYILCPAKSLQPGTPLENAVATVEVFAEEQM